MKLRSLKKHILKLVLISIMLGSTGSMFARPHAPPAGAREAEQKAAQEKKAQEERTAALIAAIQSKNAGAVTLQLKTIGDVNAMDTNKESPLVHAVRAGDLTIIRALLQKKANPTNSFGTSPTDLAIKAKNSQLVKLFLENGASLQYHFNTAASYGNAMILAHFLSRGVDINYSKKTGANANDHSPLMYAIKDGNLETATVLVQKGANVNQVVRSGKGISTPLEVAAQNANLAFTTLLLNKRADTKNTYGGMLGYLISAVDSGNVEVAKALIAAGADVKIKISLGRAGVKMTPLKYALQKNRNDFADLYRASGATE